MYQNLFEKEHFYRTDKSGINPYPAVCGVPTCQDLQKQGSSINLGRGGEGERINNISDNHSYIQILLYCMFINLTILYVYNIDLDVSWLKE